MKGRRVYPNEAGELRLAEGDYGRHPDLGWMARPPGCSMGSLEDHQVTEHEDGTITVSPSIAGEGYHGYLERGVWRSC